MFVVSTFSWLISPATMLLLPAQSAALSVSKDLFPNRQWSIWWDLSPMASLKPIDNAKGVFL